MFKFFKKISVMALEEAAVKKAIAQVVDKRTHYGFSGHPHVKAFEAALSGRFGGIPVLGVNSGTDALILALKALGIGPADEVIAPAFSFISTVSCIPWVGAMPAFVDIRFDDYAIDPTRIEEKITKRTKAILVAHLFGQPATGMAEILAIAKKHNLAVIEDAAQSFGAAMQIDGESKPVGTIGDIGCLSFSSTKPFAAPGNGGAVIIKNQSLRDEADRMRFYGARTHYYDYPTVGVNCKLHDIQAAALLAKLNFFELWLSHRQRIAAYYNKTLAGLGDLVLPQEYPDIAQRIWYRYVIRTKKRQELFNHLLKAAGPYQPLQPMLNYPVPLPYFEMFRHLGHKPGDFPVADKASEEVISLPITNYVAMADAKRIADAAKRFF
ncbi:MAG: DegT/DnrJ/EryC1/StrS family aminotransferase [Candidatus Sungiibacteriota bacterium]